MEFLLQLDAYGIEYEEIEFIDQEASLESKNSNIFSIYQISAEDVGCKIIVEVSPIDLDDVYDGTAVAEFGPVDIEPNAKQSLEYIIGSGGT